jgi:uncharacterized phage protein (TIGR01671 family)
MREIKYRAWDGSEFAFMSMDDKGIFKCGSHKHLEQFTGLQDKNGTDIYEGDIVKAFHYHHEWMDVAKVVFENGTYSVGRYWKDGCHDWCSMEQYDSDDLEVIGNIHQNPELLEEN